MAQRAATRARAEARPAQRQTKQAARTASRQGKQVASTAKGAGRRVAGQAKGQARRVQGTAVARSREVTETASRDARQLASSARNQVDRVKGEVAAQGRGLVEETRSQLESQAQGQARRMAGALRQLGSEAEALAEGRPHDAPTVADYVWRAAGRLQEAADTFAGMADGVEDRGLQGMAEDLSAYARRRPGAFLIGAAVMGFGVGRMVRAGSADGSQGPASTAGGSRR